MAKVLLKDIVKKYGAVTAVSKVNLEIPDKEFVVLVGPSGCGKTTILRCISGLEKVTEGEIYIGDNIVNDLEPKERNVAMVFQTYALYPHMTVYQNIAFPLENAKLPKPQIEEKVRKVATLLQISDLLERKPKQLSGGQRQRVALGRAMVREPQVFLMDEPLSNLDAKLRVYMRAELKKLQKDLGITTIYVTHDQVEAMTMGQKIAILDKGVLQQVGTAEEIYEHPANIFVASFIGSPAINLFDCKLVKDDNLVFDAGVFKIPVPEDFIEKARQWPEAVVLGVRPLKVIVHLTKEKDKDLTEAVLEVDEPLGDRRLLHLRIGDNLVGAMVSPDLKVETGKTVYVEFQLDRLYVFVKETGKTLLAI